MPDRSSGLVSRRTRMTGSPAAAGSTARAAVKTARPTAAPGDAPMPVVSATDSVPRSKRGNISWASCAPETRRRASSSLRAWP